MNFDFDDLDEAMPAETAAVDASIKPMSQSQFRGFWRRLETAESEGCFEDFGKAFAEAVWDKDTIPARMPKIIEAFKSLLNQVAKRSPPDIVSGGAIAFTLWQIALSTSLHETRVRSSSTPGSPCVLITGFGGSDVNDLEGQAAWYHGQGFTAISTALTGWPPALRVRHDEIVARELRTALREDGKLVLHLCSQYGVTYGFGILWRWSHNRAPFNDLPPLEKCLQAVIFECASPPNYDPSTKTIHYPTEPEFIKKWFAGASAPPVGPVAADQDDDGEENDSELDKSENKFYLNVLLGCIGAMTKKWDLSSLEEMVVKNKDVRRCLLSGARYARKPKPWVQKCQVDTGLPPDVWAAFQLLDWGREPPLPRLFLYSARDPLVTADRVEAWIRHTRAYRPEAEVTEAKLAKSLHCKLWDTEPDECAAEVSKFLMKSGLLDQC